MFEGRYGCLCCDGSWSEAGVCESCATLLRNGSRSDDVCLSNPFPHQASDNEHRPNKGSLHDQTLIAFSTSSGGLAFEGSDKHSIYTSELIRVMSEPGLTIDEIFARVRLAVSQKTGWIVTVRQNYKIRNR